MKAGGGSAKGAAFERFVCKTLSRWLSHGKRDDLLWRTAMSGGRATLLAKRGISAIAQAGDICAIDGEGLALTQNFFIECKHRKDLAFRSLLKDDVVGDLARFWGKCGEQARTHHLTPLMFVRENAFMDYVCMDHYGEHVLALSMEHRAHFPQRDLYIVTLEDFLTGARRPQDTPSLRSRTVSGTVRKVLQPRGK